MQQENQNYLQFPIIHNSALHDAAIPSQYIPHDLRIQLEVFQQKTKAPMATNFAAWFVAMATTFNRLYVVEGHHGKTIPLNVFVLVASETGEGKTSAVNLIFRPVREFENGLEERRQQSKTYTQQEKEIAKAKIAELRRKLAKSIADNEEEDILELSNRIAETQSSLQSTDWQYKMIFSDATFSGLKRALTKNLAASCLMNTDASDFIAKHLEKYSATFCSSWSGEPISIEQGRDLLESTDPRLSLLLMTQPAFADGLIDDDRKFRLSGLAARFLIFQPQSILGQKYLLQQEHPNSDLFLQRWNDMIISQSERAYLAQVSGVNSPTVLRLSDDAKIFLREKEEEIDHQVTDWGSYREVKDVAVRIIEQTCKLSACYELFRNQNAASISLEMVEMAYYFMRYYCNYFSFMASRNVPDSSAYKRANKILEFFKHSKNVTMANFQYPNGIYQHHCIPIDIFQKTSPIRGKAKYEPALQLLLENNSISISDMPFYNGIRWIPKKVIVINGVDPLVKPPLFVSNG